MSMSRVKQRALDFAIYIAIALAVSAGLIWYSAVSPPNGADLFGRWGGLAINTAILYGYMVQDSRALWHRPLFWTIIVSMLCVHLFVFIVVLLRAEEWRVLWFLAMYPTEVPIIIFLRDRIFNAERPKYRTPAR